MNCDQHQQIIIGVCLNCKTNFCEQCLSKHIKHYNRIILAQNLLYLCYEANIQCIDLYEEVLKVFDQDSRIVEFLNCQTALQSNFIDAALNEQIVLQQIEFYFSIIEKKYIRFFIIEIIKEKSLFNPKKKNKIIKRLIYLINEEDLKYLMIKNSDLHCLLLKLGLYLEAKWLFDHDIKKLLKKSIFFNNYQYELMKQSQLNNNGNIVAYEQIQTGRNFYMVNEYQKCITFMDKLLEKKPSQIAYDQAQIFKGLSLFKLDQLPKALISFRKVQDKHLIIFQLLLCVTLERMKDYDAAIQLYSNYSVQIYMSHFQKPLCNYELTQKYFFTQSKQLMQLIFETGKEDFLMYYCDNLLKINPNNYYPLLYKGVLEMKKDQGVHAKQIAENLIKLKPNKFEGYILKSACLIVNNQIDEDGEYIDAFLQQYSGSSIYFLLISKSMFRVGVFLIFEGKFDDSYEALEKIPVNYFEYKQNKLYLQLIILMHKQDYKKAFQKLIEEYENSQLFYQVIYEEFCQSLNQFNLNEKAFQYIQQQQGNLQDFHFINFIMGKSLFELKRYEEALKYFNGYSHDSCALPYVQYFKGLTLLELDLFEDAADCFECALTTEPGFNLAPHNFYFHKIVCEIMFGCFDKAQELYDLNCCAQSTLRIFFQGFLQYILGKTKEAQHILKDAKLNQEFPIVSFLQSKNLSTLGWIMEEENLVGPSQYFQNMAYRCEPQLQQFKNKFSFFTNGPYSKYIMKNQAKFDNYDDKKFFNIKFMAIFIETYGYNYQLKNYQVILANILNQQLLTQVHKEHIKKQDRLINNYPFV